MLSLLFRALSRLPLAWLHRAGAALGWVIYWCSPTYRRRLRGNLTASGVCAGAAQRRSLLRQAIAEAGKGVAELAALWFGPEEELSRLVVECRGWERVQAARAAGRGIVFLTPHLGCFEICALYGAQRLPLTVLYRPPKLGWLEPLMVAGRTRTRATAVPANLKGVRALYRALARGEAVGLLPDQAPGAGEGVWAGFFGRPAYTMTLARRLAQASGAAVILAVAERLPRGRGYRLHLEEIAAQGFDEAALNRAIEQAVRRWPAQYLWSYNRYKIPAGAPPPTTSQAGGREPEAS
ncbi:MAG TPA: lysophospholipid acyltransferase family protein [Burkholderiales bacterium]|nr:lysophospholipid acyltransferase family protein [Burkholderiales bacterium]